MDLDIGCKILNMKNLEIPRGFLGGCFVFPCLGMDNDNKNTALPSNHVCGANSTQMFLLFYERQMYLITVHVSFEDTCEVSNLELE